MTAPAPICTMPHCEERARAGFRTCEGCAAANRVNARAMRERRRKTGRCLACGGRLELDGRKQPRFIKCADCCRRDAEDRGRLRARRKAMELCRKCGERPPRPGRTLCEGCAVNRKAGDAARYLRRKAEGEVGGAACSNIRDTAARGARYEVGAVGDTRKGRQFRAAGALSIIC